METKLKPIEFEIEGRAISWNKIYSSPHWTTRKKLSDEQKWLIKAALVKYRINKMPLEAPVSIRFDVYVGRPIDCDNVCLKTIIDGLREWGLLKNDDPRFVSEVSIAVHSKSVREYIKVTIIL